MSEELATSIYKILYRDCGNVDVCLLNFKRRIKSHLPFAGIIRSSPYFPRFQDKGYV